MGLNPSAEITSATYVPDQLIACNADQLLTEKVTLVSGQNLERGAVVGRYAVDATVEAAADAGNTGNGTLTLGTPKFGAAVKEGRYRVTCIEPATNGGTFLVQDPFGVAIGRATVGNAFDGEIKFTVADGATDFAAGDAFSVDASALVYKWKLSAKAATDGSQVPRGVLQQDCNASAGDKEALVYRRGWFNETALTLGTGHTVATIRETLAAQGIILVPATAA